MMGILWGICGAMCIGGSDCIARVTSKHVSVTVLFLFIMGLSTTVLTLWISLSGNWPPWHTWAWIASALSGILNLVALYFLYRALARGPVAVASPAASSFTVLLVGLNILSGEPWNLRQAGAMLVVFIGVIMLSKPTASDIRRGQYDAVWLRGTTAYALAAAVAVSVRMFLAQEAGAQIGAMNALYLNRVFALVGVLIMLSYALLHTRTLMWPRRSMVKLVLLQAALESFALGAFLVGSNVGGRISATIGFSTFAAATALLAWWWLGERIGWQRGFWIFVVGLGAMFSVSGA